MSTSTSTAAQPVYQLHTADNFGLGSDFSLIKKYKKDEEDGESPYILENVPVFRSGTFRDSWGEQHDWSHESIEAIVSNFDDLKATLLPHIPVRDKHKGFLSGGGEVVGYHTALRSKNMKSTADDKQYLFLLADYEITEPDAEGKIRRGTWRNRSSEIGRYVNNSDEEVWPVYMGMAYVDFPAVEGLEGHSKEEQQRKFIFMSDRGVQVTQSTAPVQPPVPPVPPIQPVQPPVVVTPAAFTIGGETVTDPVEVQRRIAAFEAAQRESQAANRKAFVGSLVTGNKILAAQQASYEAFAEGLAPEQYTQWEAMMNGAPAASLLGQHGQQEPAPERKGEPLPADQQKIADAKEIVANHRRSSLPQGKLVMTPSFQILVAAGLEKN